MKRVVQSNWVLQDVIRMIVQYLQDEGYVASIMTIQDEASVRFTENLRNRSHFKRIKLAILGTVSAPSTNFLDYDCQPFFINQEVQVIIFLQYL